MCLKETYFKDFESTCSTGNPRKRLAIPGHPWTIPGKVHTHTNAHTRTPAPARAHLHTHTHTYTQHMRAHPQNQHYTKACIDTHLQGQQEGVAMGLRRGEQFALPLLRQGGERGAGRHEAVHVDAATPAPPSHRPTLRGRTLRTFRQSMNHSRFQERARACDLAVSGSHRHDAYRVGPPSKKHHVLAAMP